MEKHQKNLAIVSAVFLALLIGVVFYFTLQLKATNENTKNLAQQMQKGLLDLHASISNLSTEVGFVDTNLEGFKKQSQQEITTLSELLMRLSSKAIYSFQL